MLNVAKSANLVFLAFEHNAVESGATIHHKYQKEKCKQFLFHQIHHDIAVFIQKISISIIIICHLHFAIKIEVKIPMNVLHLNAM